MGTREIILSAVVPAGVSLVVLLLTHIALSKLTRRGVNETGEHSASGKGTRVLGAVFVVLACGATVLGAYAWQSRVDLWPVSVTHRFPVFALAALIAGLACVLSPARRSPIAGAALGALAGGFVGWAVLAPLPESLISEAQRWGWIVGTGVIAGIQAWAIAIGARALTGWSGPALVWLIAGVTALGATAGLANAPLVLWPLAAAAFGLALPGLLRRRENLLAGCAPAIAVLLTACVSVSHWYGSEERWPMFALLSAAPLGFALAAVPALRGKPLVVRLIPAAAVSLGLAGAQAGLALPALIEATTGSGDDYYSGY